MLKYVQCNITLHSILSFSKTLTKYFCIYMLSKTVILNVNCNPKEYFSFL